jgi:hypothetical protein
MPDNPIVWGQMLKEAGFTRHGMPNFCPICYTAADMCKTHHVGILVLVFSAHVATVVDGDLYDAWDSTEECPQFYWSKESDL